MCEYQFVFKKKWSKIQEATGTGESQSHADDRVEDRVEAPRLARCSETPWRRDNIMCGLSEVQAYI